MVVRRKHFDKNHCFSIFIPIWISMKIFFVNLISQNQTQKHRNINFSPNLVQAHIFQTSTNFLIQPYND